MVNPGAFRGSRKDFMMGEKLAYTIGVIGGYAADAVATIQRRYLKRFPIDLPHEEEPSEEFLKSVDDDAPDPEPVAPNEDLLTKTEYQEAVEKLTARTKLLKYRKAQIKRWLEYQYLKDNDVKSKQTGAYTPYTTLMKKLTGKDIARPRQRSPANVWRKTQCETIEKALKVEILNSQRLGRPISADQYAAIRDRIARNLFANMDEGEKRMWRQKALAEHSLALEKYNEEVNDNPSEDPADRQQWLTSGHAFPTRAIQGLTRFMQPILDMAAAVTGWKVTLLAGGPEPALAGRLSTLSIHSGYTSGDVKMTFGRSEHVQYRKYVVPVFGSFLQKCYSPEECRARALPDDADYLPMSALEQDTDEATFHTIDELPSLAVTLAARETGPHATPVSLQISSANGASNAPLGIPTHMSGNTVNKPSNLNNDHSLRHLTQDSLPSNANPFPFDEVDDDDDLHVSGLDSPTHSAPPSPPISRMPSPTPPQHNTATAPAASAINIAAPEAPEPLGHVDTVNMLNETTKKRKRGELDIPEVEAGTKRNRTKSDRAKAADEQMSLKTKGKGGKKKASVGGKENKDAHGKNSGGRGGSAKTATTKQKRR